MGLIIRRQNSLGKYNAGGGGENRWQQEKRKNMRWFDSIKKGTALILQDLSTAAKDRAFGRSLLYRITMRSKNRREAHYFGTWSHKHLPSGSKNIITMH